MVRLTKAYIVDDESLALKNMEKMLQQFNEITIIGKFQNPSEAIEAFRKEKADVVFLDIEMPVMNGLQAAEHYQQIDPKVMVVFTTAYDTYAVDAFELQALDYILKPIRRDRLEQTLQRVIDTSKIEIDVNVKEQTIIRMFGALQYEQQGQLLESFQWRTSKAQELFAYLLHVSNAKVRRDVLVDILWPNSDPDKAYTNLYTAVYQLRRTLRQMNLGIHIISGEDGYYLEHEEDVIRIDVQQWEQFMISATPITTESLAEHRAMLALNRGEYLGTYDYVWAESKRQRLEMQWLYHAVKMCDFLMEAKSYPEAMAVCQDMQQRFPYNGYSYFTLMKVFAALGDLNKVEAQYTKLTDLLAEELGEAPEQYITDWYLAWKGE